MAEKGGDDQSNVNQIKHANFKCLPVIVLLTNKNSVLTIIWIEYYIFVEGSKSTIFEFF